MRLEVPVLQRCCFCLPLRYGLLAWAYFKLMIALLFLGLVIRTSCFVISRANNMDMTLNIIYCVIALLILIILLDISLTVVFIVGGHKKNTRLIKVYYYYSIVIVCIYILLFSASTTLEFISEIPFIERAQDSSMFILYAKTKIFVGLANMSFQLYLILLVRSEFIKISNARKFRFTNPIQTEARCQMETDQNNIQNNFWNKDGTTTDINVKVEYDRGEIENKGIKVKNCNNKNMNSDVCDKILNNYKYTPINNIDV